MKEGNEIHCPYALGEWREAVCVKLIPVALSAKDNIPQRRKCQRHLHFALH